MTKKSSISAVLLLLSGLVYAAAVRDTPTGVVTFSQTTTPSTPSSGKTKLYFKSDNKLYKKTSAGVESEAGGVVGPASATDNALVVFDGTTGSLVKNSSVTVSGSTITGTFSGNSTSATALAANPTDCSANNMAISIDASGNLTCAQISNSYVASGAAIAYSKLNLANGIVNADVNTSAAIARSKLAVGTGNYVAINDASGFLTQEAALAKSRGGTGADNTSVTFPSTGTIATIAGTEVITNKDIDGGTASNTSRITLPKASTSTLNALTRKAGTVAFDTTRLKPVFDDGSTLQVIGSGSGGQYDINSNLLTSSGCETDTTGWTASGGTLTRDTTTANLGGKATGVCAWDPSATSQTLSDTALTVTANDRLSGKNGVISCSVKTAATDLKLQVYDGTNVISPNSATDVVTASSAGYVRSSFNFIFPASGTVTARFASQSNSAIAYFKDCYFGLAENFNTSQVSQATVMGTISYDTCTGTNWSTTSTSYVIPTAMTTCTVVTTGSAQAAATQTPSIKFTSLPPGDYVIEYEGGVQNNTAAKNAIFRFTDGTINAREQSQVYSAGGNVSSPGVRQSFTYTSAQSNVTWSLSAKTDSGGTAIIHGDPGVIRVYRFPTSSEQAISINKQTQPTQQKFLSGSGTYITPIGVSYLEVLMVGGGGGGAGSGTTSGTAATGGTASYFRVGASPDLLVANGGGFPAFGNGSGSISVGGTASLGTGPTGTNLSGAGGSGSGSTQSSGANFSGGVGAASPLGGGGAAGGGQNATAVAGQNAPANTGAGGGGAACPGTTNSTAGGGGAAGGFIRALITAPVSSYNYNVGTGGTGGGAGGGTGAAAGGAGGSGYILVTEYYGAANAPWLIGSVTSNSSGAERIERLSGSSAGAVSSQSGTWISGSATKSTGIYTWPITAGIFSAAPTCTCTSADASSGAICAIDNVSTSSFRVVARTAGTAADNTHQVICMGPR